jgi:hypothetical protein
MESYHKVDIESLQRKMKEHTHILREIYLTMILLVIFIFLMCLYLMFDKYYGTTYQPIPPVTNFYV